MGGGFKGGSILMALCFQSSRKKSVVYFGGSAFVCMSIGFSIKGFDKTFISIKASTCENYSGRLALHGGISERSAGPLSV